MWKRSRRSEVRGVVEKPPRKRTTSRIRWMEGRSCAEATLTASLFDVSRAQRSMSARDYHRPDDDFNRSRMRRVTLVTGPA